jgi:site-specific recombinase XerD
MRRYLDWLEARRMRPSTLALNEHQLGAFLRWLADHDLGIDNLDSKVVARYFHDLKASGYQHNSLRSVLIALRWFAKFSLHDKLVSQDPTQGICRGCFELRRPSLTSPSILRQLSSRPAFPLKYRLPIFGPSWERYLRQRVELGYSRTYILRALQYNFHFHSFLAKRGIRHLAQISPAHMNEFIGSKRILSQRRDRPLLRVHEDAPAYIQGFLRYARPNRFRDDVVRPESLVVPKRLMDRYLHFCSSHQGYRATTQSARRLWIGKLGLSLDGQGLRDISSLSIRHVDDFMLEQAQRLKPRSLHSVASSLRCFLRYLFLRGTISSNLAQRVARPVRFSADLRPKFLSWKKIEELLAAIDRSDVVGKRDYAMVLLMANQGLRSHEVAGLRVADIDFEDRAMLISARKTGPSQRLPLSPRTADALRDYLTVRPASIHPELFLRVRAPRRPLGDSVKVIVRVRLLRHLGASIPHHGAHLLRHSFAKALLDRGATLPDIGGLLGHRRLDSTLTYTRVDTEGLREVADNYAQLITADQGSPP